MIIKILINGVIIMNQLNLNEHEKMFNIKPVGIKYKCEFCNDGEMKLVTEDLPFIYEDEMPNMHPHRCTKCGKMMLLPKMYPYIEWVPEDSNLEDK